MPQRSEEAAAFFAAVYSAISEIPQGKVTSYGHIARLVGKRESKIPCPYVHAKPDSGMSAASRRLLKAPPR